MGNKRITDLSPITNPTGLSAMPIVHQGAVRQISLDNLFKYVDANYIKTPRDPATTDDLGFNYGQLKLFSGNFMVSGSDMVRINEGKFRVDNSGLFQNYLSGQNVHAYNLNVDNLNVSGGAVQGNLTIIGNLTVSGDLTALSTDFEIEDKNITLASVPTGLHDNPGLDGAGFTVKGSASDKHITWYNSDGGTWQVDQNFEVERKLRVTGTATLDSGIYLTNSNINNPLRFGSNINAYASGSNSDILAVDQNVYVKKSQTIAQNVYIQNNLDVSGNQTRLLGDVTLGSSASNQITFLGGFVQDIKPVNDWLNEASTPFQSLGNEGKRWKNVFAGKGNFHDSINLTGNAYLTGDAFISGSVYLGDSSSDKLEIQSTPTFKSPNSYFQNNVNASGDLNIGSSSSKHLSVNSKVYLNDGDLFVKNNQTISGNLILNGATLQSNATPVFQSSQNYIQNNLNVGQIARVSGGLIVGTNSNVILNTTTDSLNVTGDLRVSHSGYFSSGIKIGDSTVIISPNNITINNDPVVLNNDFSTLSGNLLNSGYSLITQLYSLSGNLGATGNTLALNLGSTGNTLNINLANTGAALNNKTDLLSGSAVLLYGEQNINGVKNFNSSVYINRLYVTGAETIVNTQNIAVQSPYLLLNLTGGANDGGIFFVTGSTLTGVTDYGPILGFDHSDRFVFGIARRSDDLSTLNQIAAFGDLTNYSGFVDAKYSTIQNLNTTGNNLQISLSSTISNLETTGNTLANQINSLSGDSATKANLELTGFGLTSRIDSLSGIVNGLPTEGNLAITGSTLNDRLVQLSGVTVLQYGNQSVSGEKTFDLLPKVSGYALVPSSFRQQKVINLETQKVSQLINLDFAFPILPTINLMLEDRNIPPTDDFLLYRVTGLSTSGFFVHLSQPIRASDSGYYLHVTANI